MISPPSRREKALWVIFYTAIAVSGVFVLVVPPITIDAPVLTALWGFMLTAALVLAVAAVLGRYKWEYTTLPLVIAGVAIYAFKVWYFTWFNPSQGAKAALITALAVILTMRWFERRALVLQDKERQRADPDQAG